MSNGSTEGGMAPALHARLAGMVASLREWSAIDSGPALTVADPEGCFIDADPEAWGRSYVEMPVSVAGFEVPLVMDFVNDEADGIRFELYADRARRALQGLAAGAEAVLAMLAEVGGEAQAEIRRRAADGRGPTLGRITLAGISLDDHHRLDLRPDGFQMRARIHLKDGDDEATSILEARPGEVADELGRHLDDIAQRMLSAGAGSTAR